VCLCSVKGKTNNSRANCLMFTCVGEGEVWQGQEAAGRQGKQARKQEKGNITTFLLSGILRVDTSCTVRFHDGI